VLQTLFHIPSRVAGVPLFGSGLLLVLWGFFALLLMFRLVRRQGFCADTWSYLPLVLIVAAVLWKVAPALCDAKGLPIRGYGVMILTAVVAGTALVVRRARRVGLESEFAFALAFWMCLPGFLGARILYVAKNWSEQYWPVYKDPNGGTAALLTAMVNVAQGGLVVYGALLGGLVGLLLFYRKYRMPLLASADLVAPSLALGLALGRIGCLLNGCCFGDLCESPWGLKFPAGSPPYSSQVARGVFWGLVLSEEPTAKPIVSAVEPGSPAALAGLHGGDHLANINGRVVQWAGDAHVLFGQCFEQREGPVLELVDGRFVRLPTIEPPSWSRPIHPTQIYAAISAFLLCLVLLAWDPFCRRDGQLFAMMLTLYPIARFLEETIRTDETSFLGTGLHISQNISLLILLCVIGLWIYIGRQPPGRAWEARQYAR
jgi:phosphatidylglycerol:prolipoprotein diacylglycerol transferase